jgi:hypothetical protein
VSRDPSPGRDPDDEPPEPPGHIRPTGAGALIGFALTGMVLGWAVPLVVVAVTGHRPRVGWTPVLALLLVAVIVGSVAWSTYRTIHRRGLRLPPHQAVNRLVLAKSCALVGAVVAGGYFGYAFSWVGRGDASLAREPVGHALLAGVCGLLIAAGSLLLERACRVPPRDR